MKKKDEMSEVQKAGAAKIRNFMNKFDKIVCECDTVEDGLALASAMLTYSKNMYETVLGKEKTALLMIEQVMK